MTKKSKVWTWMAACQWLLWWTTAASANNNNIEITTSDPLLINAETNAYALALLNDTPPTEPIVFRVDQLTDALVEHANSTIVSEQDRIHFVMNPIKYISRNI